MSEADNQQPIDFTAADGLDYRRRGDQVFRVENGQEVPLPAPPGRGRQQVDISLQAPQGTGEGGAGAGMGQGDPSQAGDAMGGGGAGDGAPVNAEAPGAVDARGGQPANPMPADALPPLAETYLAQRQTASAEEAIARAQRRREAAQRGAETRRQNRPGQQPAPDASATSAPPNATETPAPVDPGPAAPTEPAPLPENVTAESYAEQRVGELLPTPPVPPAGEVPQERRTGVLANAMEIPVAIGAGMRGALASLFEASDDLADVLNRLVPLSSAPAGDPSTPGRSIGRFIRGLAPMTRRTVTGDVAQEATQVIAGFVGGLGVLRRLGWTAAPGATLPATMARGAAAGAIADFFFNEADESNLVDLWRTLRLPDNAITEFLATDPTDMAAANRLRNAAQGVVAGAALDALVATAGAVRAAMRARQAREAVGGAVPAARPAAPGPQSLTDAAGATPSPQRDVILNGDANRPLVEVMSPAAAPDPQARLRGSLSATSPTRMGISPQRAAVALDDAAREALARAEALDVPVWLRGEPVGMDGLPTPPDGLPENIRELVNAMRTGRIGPRGEVSLSSFIRAQGGVQNQGGEVLAEIGSVRTMPGLVNNRGGLTLDRAIEAAVQDGYLPPGSTINDFLRALGDDATGRMRSYGQTTDEAGRAVAAAARDLDETLGALGGSIRDTDADIAARLGFEAPTSARTAADLAGQDAARMGSESRGGEFRPGEVYVNWGRLQTTDDIRAVLRDMADAFRPGVDAARRGVQSNADTEALARALNLTPERLLQRQAGEAWNAETITAARMLYEASGAQLVTSARAAAAANAGVLEQMAFRRMMALHHAIQAQFLGAQAEAGRALQAFRIPVAGGAQQLRAIQDTMEAMGGDATSVGMARRLATLADNVAPDALPAAISQFTARGAAGRTLEAIQEIWINALLSNPATHAVNAFGNALVMPLTVVERRVAGMISSARGAAPGEGVAAQEYAAMWYGMMAGWGDALRLAGRTWRDDGSELAELLGRQDMPFEPRVGSRSFGLDPGGTAGRALDLLGHSVVRVPGRAMAASDAFFKSMNFRGALHAGAHREALRRLAETGQEATAENMRRTIAEVMSNPPEHLMMEAADTALYATFNRQAGPITQRMLALASTDSPGFNLAARVVMPFIRTPMNILSYGFERSPVAPLVGQWRADIAAGGARRDLALARMATGTMMMGAAYDWASDGRVSGAGPREAREREALERTGWRPYSIRVGDTWLAFNRIDPFGMLLGTAADMVTAEATHDWDDGEYERARESMAEATAFFGRALVERSPLSGAADLFEALSNDPRSPFSYAGRVTGSLFAPGLVGFAERIVDPETRDAQTVWERIQARIPGMSDDLLLRRNLWGEPVRPGVQSILGGETAAAVFNAITPVGVSPARGRPIDRELLRLRYSPPAVSPTQNFGGELVSLRDFPAALDEMRRLAGNELKLPQYGGLGLADALDALVEGRAEWMVRRISPGPGPAMISAGDAYQRSTDDGRIAMIRQIRAEFSREARAELPRRHPDLAERLDMLRTERERRLGEEQYRGTPPAPPRASTRQPAVQLR